MSYPSTLDAFLGTGAQGTSSLTSPDHALDHRMLGSAAGSLEAVVGTTSGTNVLKSFNAGDFPFRINASNVLQQVISGGTINNSIFGTVAGTGGTFNGLTLGTPVIGTISVPGTTVALGFSAAIAPGVGSVADVAGGTLTVNAQAGQIYYCAMGTAAGNRTIGTPQNPTGYQQLTYAFKASGSANGTLLWASVFRFSQESGTPTLGTGTTWNYYGWRYNPIDTKYDFMGQSRQII